MVRLASLVCAAALTGGASAFVATPFSASSKESFLRMSDEPEVAEVVEAPAAPARPSSGLKIPEVRNAISSLTKENFSETLTKIEPFLTNDAGATIYAKSMKRIAVQAKHLGTEVPTGYALDAVATQKRREKQDAFIKVKEEERLAAEAEAADAAAEAVEEEAAPVEEEAAEPVVA